jgi:hypothetical protein
MRVGQKKGVPVHLHPRAFFDFAFFGFGYKVFRDFFTHWVLDYDLMGIFVVPQNSSSYNHQKINNGRGATPTKMPIKAGFILL